MLHQTSLVLLLVTNSDRINEGNNQAVKESIVVAAYVC